MQQEVLDLLLEAIHNFYQEDQNLLDNKVSERCVCARLALHLDRLINSVEYSNDFHGYYVDVEYDRMQNRNPKQIKGNRCKIVSDLLIHSRGTNPNQDNLLALEMKIHNNYNNVKKDKDRLIKMVQQEESPNELPYVCNTLLGVFLRLQRNRFKYVVFTQEGATEEQTMTCEELERKFTDNQYLL